MTVEAGGGVMGEERDEFPLGMRVLAVDDDVTCLKILGAMLSMCNYHVTTTNQAVEALKMLRDNKDRFDLIITDVHMPDMDGFKLLELVGLEMDLPVIMLSGNGDTKLVMKGITHGACDYLLKPVRLEELKNIWQHVIRKKKSAPREHNSSDNGLTEVEQGPNTSGSSEHKLNRKRKDQTEDEEDDTEENETENENTSSQKKARVVWSVELHRKFMAAVNHLGISKAVPKRILDLMNVEGLTRENVASHLQKYRLYLKKVTTHEANFGAASGVRDSYPPLAALDGFDFHSLRSPSQLSALQSFQQNGGRSRKDSTVFVQNIAPGMVQGGHSQNSSKPVNDLDRFHHVMGSYHGNLNPSIPAAVDQLQQHKRMIHFPSSGLRSGGSSNPLGVITNNPLTLHPAHSSIGFSSGCSGPFEMSALAAPHFSGSVRCNETLQNGILSTGTANSLAMCSTGSPAFLQVNSNPLSFPSSSTPAAPLCQSLTGNAMAMLKDSSEDSKYLKFGSAQLRGAKHEHAHEPNIAFSSSLNTPLAGHSIVDTPSHSQRLNDVMFNRRAAANMNDQSDYSSLFLPQECKIDKSIVDGQLIPRDFYSLQSSTIQGLLGSSGYSDNELMNVIKSKREDALFMDG